MTDMQKSQVVGVLVKVKDSNGTIKTIGPLLKFTKSDKGKIRKALLLYISLKGNNYSSITSSSLTFQYIYLSNETVTDTNLPTVKKADSYSFGRYTLPLTTDLSQSPIPFLSCLHFLYHIKK